MSRIGLRLDGELDAVAKAAAAAERVNLSEWVRRVLVREVDRLRAVQARAEEDARQALHSPEEEAALVAARARRHVQFDTVSPTAGDATGAATAARSGRTQ